MAKYELTDQQVKQLLIIISNANVRGSDAPAIMSLTNALKKPLIEKVSMENK
ncbi:MAG: hypothetical protein ACTSUF_10260 [Candidatus Heimdallarchaeaceae archaeon]